MSAFPYRAALGATFLLLALTTAAGAVKSDLVPPEMRRRVVDLAARLTQPAEIAPLPDDLKSPFNPADFDKPDPEEQKALAAAQPVANTGPVRPTSPREILDAIAARIQPSGTMILGGQPILLFREKKLKVGDKLTITFEGSDYDLEITAIERTTFTLRLQGEETTRPIIKPGKSQ